MNGSRKSRIEWSALAWMAGALVVACTPSSRLERVDPALIDVAAGAHMRTDLVGEGPEARPATFVLVDAHNRSSHDAYVTLTGVLLAADQHEVGGLRPDEVFMPAGALRTFVLVDEGVRDRPDAVGAQVKVRTAKLARRAPQVAITDFHVFQDQGRVVVAANVTNTVGKAGTAVVLASFHDRDGRPIARPFSIFQLGPNAVRTARFAGPQGSVTGDIYIGEVTY